MTAPALFLLLAVPLVLAAPPPGHYTVESDPDCDPDLCLLWSAAHHGPYDQAAAQAIVLSPDGEIAYVVGGTFQPSTSTDLAVWAIEVSTGSLLWSAVYNGPKSSDEGEILRLDLHHAALTPDGETLLVAGISNGQFQHGHDVVTLAYDTTDGTELWSARYNGPAGRDDRPLGVTATADGRYAVTVAAATGADGFGQWAILGYDVATGALLWQHPVRASCTDAVPFPPAAAPEGSLVYVAGTTANCVRDTVAVDVDTHLGWVPTLLAIDAQDGSVVWEHRDLDVDHAAQSAMLRGFVRADDGQVLLTTMFTNRHNSEGDLDIIVDAFARDGNPQWSTRYDSGGYDEAEGVTLDPVDDRLYVVATSPALGTFGVADQNLDLVVFSIDTSDGSTVWQKRIDASSDDPVGDQALLGDMNERVVIVHAPVFDQGRHLAVGFETYHEPQDPFAFPSQPYHRLVVLDTTDGTVAAERLDHLERREYAYGAHRDRADFLGVGSHGDFFSYTAGIRRFTIDQTAPVLDLPEDMRVHATGPEGGPVDFSTSAQDDRGPAASTCSHEPGTFPLGTTTVRCSAHDPYGNEAHSAFQVTVADTTPPALTLPEPIAATASSATGANVSFTATAEDDVDGTLSAICTPAAGAFDLGTTDVSCTSTDASGNTATGTFAVTVTYAWSGWTPPIEEDGSFQHGRTLPVKFTLAHESAGITDASASLMVVADGAESYAVSAQDEGQAFAYDAKADAYVFHWDTGTVPPGPYALQIDLGDDTQNTVQVRLV